MPRPRDWLPLPLSLLALLALFAGCSSGSPSTATTDGDGGLPIEMADGAPALDAPASSDSGPHPEAGKPDSGPPPGSITCPGPGMPKNNGGSCGTERWSIKTGTDTQAKSLSLVPQPTKIATLTALPAAGGGSVRESPTETTLWELKDVTLSELKLESDSDYHMVLADGAATMLAEIPSPSCATASTWLCFISRARSEIDAKYNVSTSPQYPGVTVTVRGIGFFDFLHGQTGVAPNGIELHPTLQICFGQGCTPS